MVSRVQECYNHRCLKKMLIFIHYYSLCMKIGIFVKHLWLQLLLKCAAVVAFLHSAVAIHEFINNWMQEVSSIFILLVSYKTQNFTFYQNETSLFKVAIP